MVANFNSIKVRLELQTIDGENFAVVDFNSIKVRLELLSDEEFLTLYTISIP